MANYTYHDLFVAARRALRKVDGENSEFTARQIVAAATDRTMAQLVADFQLSVFQRDIKRVSAMVERHLEGEPVAYILGKWEFYGIPLTVTPDVLIPRDDTEAVCAMALDQLGGMQMERKRRQESQTVRVLDLCCGSGCIGLAIAAKLRESRVTLADISPEALKIARRNALDNQLGGRVSCVEVDAKAEPPKFLGSFDLIVSNPPYVTAQQMENLDHSVKDYEPRLALYGGWDGLDFYRAIAKNYSAVLRPGGYLCFEFGMGQEDQVCNILNENGYRLVRLVRDSGERARAVMAQWPEMTKETEE